ncbi:hypothetical protein E4T42_08689 [Aureobasidium subglaciale]|nr:hypothetical protein E4T38_09430 [Aureobasidium subglaciale]KAI5213901.1 hypothetical protein E4T40_09385 [Aureobasidium subglaciale]KAI5216165.1 hypothetical protein E4T41_09386 [Aureobasidium subglaciale]KAI5239452.1 hypothetical protein E4T42_08689 [Aureobasidium subglaciale]KAI5254134.1 hypothetical protein E4T46_09341 [Aureobasidium subglaciale]
MVRLKHRYLLVNILYPESETPTKPATKDGQVPDIVSFRRPSSDKLNAQLLARIIRDGVTDLFGDYGSGMIASSLVAIVRVSRAHYRLVWAALSFVTHLPRPIDQACVIQIVRVSGTIRKAEEEAIRRAKAAILRATAREKGSEFALDKMLGSAGALANTRPGAQMGIESDSEDGEDEMDED